MTMIRLERQGDVFVLAMAAGENRWNTTFVRAFDEALDEVAASDGPASLVTVSDSEKFFSNGLDLAHAFGAGFMIALCHDVRVMREDRGYLCANEVELGFSIPEPELALFRHKMPMNAFFETVQLARRWNAVDALAAGIVQQVAPQDAVRDEAIKTAEGLAKLAKNREVYGWMKEHIYGENAAINGVHGPAFMLRNQSMYPHGPGGFPSKPPQS
jgi:enoyl-CoA hydratase/carnithine racemase